MSDIGTVDIGDLRVVRILEQVGPGFTPAQLYPDWDDAVLLEHESALVPGSYDPALGRFIASIHSWLLRLDGRTILIDTCAGNDRERSGLARCHRQRNPYLERLASAGVRPEEVDMVMCTHLHADHCGWNTRLVDGRWVPTFPNARYIYSHQEATHWACVGSADPLGTLVYDDSVLPIVEAGLEQLVDGDETLLPGLQLHRTRGHSPGHIAIALERPGGRGLFIGDVMHQPVQVFRPEWNSAFCYDAEEARRSRRWVLETASETGATLLTAHFAGSSAGTVTARGSRFDWAFHESGQ